MQNCRLLPFQQINRKQINCKSTMCIQLKVFLAPNGLLLTIPGRYICCSSSVLHVHVAMSVCVYGSSGMVTCMAAVFMLPV